MIKAGTAVEVTVDGANSISADSVVYKNATADLQQRVRPWWATKVGSKRWKRVFGVRNVNGQVQAQMRRKNDKLYWTPIDGLSCIRGDEQ